MFKTTTERVYRPVSNPPIWWIFKLPEEGESIMVDLGNIQSIKFKKDPSGRDVAILQFKQECTTAPRHPWEVKDRIKVLLTQEEFMPIYNKYLAPFGSIDTVKAY